MILETPQNNTWKYWLESNVPFIDRYQVIWVKTYKEFQNYINIIGMPDVICFDHDLGMDESGFDAAKWLIEYCMDNNSELPEWCIQSVNPVGSINIDSLLNSFKRFMEYYN